MGRALAKAECSGLERMCPQVRAILDGLGLGHLAPRFAAEDIDISVFRLLRDGDLRELGLTIGQRRKVLAAIAGSRGGADGAELSGDAEALPGLELRRLTVLFCDMVGSTELATRLSPDDMHGLMQAYYRAVRSVAKQQAGFVASLQGDGVVLLFGYPHSRGGSAGRAIAAGMALQEALATLRHRVADGQEVPIITRIGIATGKAIVGYPEDAPTSEGLKMVGPVVNRAARLQTLARPGTLVTDEATRDEAETLYRFERLPAAVLKGFGEAVAVSRVVGRQDPQPSQQPQPEPAGALTGREREADRLRELFQDACDARPAFVLVSGEAGIGKSTLVSRFLAQVSDAGARVVRLACLSLATNLPLRPVIDHVDSLIGASVAGDPDARRDALRGFLPDVTEAEFAGLASLLGSEAAQTAAGPKPDRAHLLGLLARWLTRSDRAPVVLAVEDLHWADATTRDLLQRCAEVAEDPGLLIVATSRDAEDPLWSADPRRRAIEVRRLDRTASERLLETALGGRGIPDAVRDLVLARSDGNPLMIGVLARTIDAMGDADLQHEVNVPTSIYESISGRIDGLHAGKALANALAVLDAPATEATLGRLTALPAEDLRQGLSELLEEGVVVWTEDQPRPLLHFSHSLFREVIYERLIRAQRRDLHRAALAHLRETDPGMEEQRPGILAWHAAEADDHAAAAPLSVRAGEQALSRSALIEATYHLDRALASIDRLPPGRSAQTLKLRALAALAAIKRARLGIASDEAGALGREVLALARQVQDTRSELLALNGLYAHALVRADYLLAGAWAAELGQVAEMAQDATFRMIAERGAGVVAMHTARLAPAIAGLRAALDRYDVDRHLPLAHAHGYDHAEICAVFLSFALWLSGDLVEAERISRFSVEHSESIDHAHSLAQALAFRSLLAALARNADVALRAGTRAAEIGARFGLPVMRGAGDFFADAARLVVRSGAPDQIEMAEFLAKRDAFLAVNPYNYGPLAATLVAEVMLRRGETGQAMIVLDEAEATERRTAETWTRPELLRLKASGLVASGDPGAAKALRKEAFALADETGARTLALRIACDMADDSMEARDLVADQLGRLVSTDSGWDIRRAQSLLGLAGAA